MPRSLKRGQRGWHHIYNGIKFTIATRRKVYRIEINPVITMTTTTSYRMADRYPCVTASHVQAYPLENRFRSRFNGRTRKLGRNV